MCEYVFDFGVFVDGLGLDNLDVFDAGVLGFKWSFVDFFDFDTMERHARGCVRDCWDCSTGCVGVQVELVLESGKERDDGVV